MLAPVTTSNLSSLPGIAHGFFTRQGGVSTGIYDALNCGAGSRDAPEAVSENRDRVARHLGAFSVLTLHQIHSATVIVADTLWPAGDRPKADAIVTRTPGLAVGALSADCAPVLFADAEARVVAAAHAGWRGAVGGILEATIEAMLALGAKPWRIQAAVGPTIGPRIYEVGPDFQAQVLAIDGAAARHFHAPTPGARVHFDLPAYVAARLRRAHIGVADETPLCTYEAHQQFFSFRRSQAQKETDYGRQISAIVLT